MEAYLDIETTGLSRYYHEITVVGIGRSDGRNVEVTQLYESTLTRRTLRRALRGVESLFTYNGRRFDLPFIRQQLGIDVESLLNHRDLMFDCWNRDLYGGLKAVERHLGITRQLPGIDGLEAINLWNRYTLRGDAKSLNTLLAYNKEDVVNLAALRAKLAI